MPADDAGVGGAGRGRRRRGRRRRRDPARLGGRRGRLQGADGGPGGRRPAAPQPLRRAAHEGEARPAPQEAAARVDGKGADG